MPTEASSPSREKGPIIAPGGEHDAIARDDTRPDTDVAPCLDRRTEHDGRDREHVADDHRSIVACFLAIGAIGLVTALVFARGTSTSPRTAVSAS